MPESRERPILFSGPMVRAILDGRKTETRRVVKPQPKMASHAYRHPEDGWWTFGDNTGDTFTCPYGQPGDLLYVREAFCYATDSFAVTVGTGYRADHAVRLRGDLPASTIKDGTIVYNGHAEDWPNNVKRWRPSIHMPKWAARIWLRVTDVRVERVQDITEAGAKAEGAPRGSWPEDCTPDDQVLGEHHGYTPPTSYRAGFARLWDSINADRGHPWDQNPWVWVVRFERTEASHA